MRTKTTEKKPQVPATIETVKLDNVTGGCAACGNPNHRPESELAYQQQR